MFRGHSFVDIIMKVWDCQWSIYFLSLVDALWASFGVDIRLYETALVFLKLWYTQLTLLNIDNIYPKYSSTHQGCSLVLLCKKNTALILSLVLPHCGQKSGHCISAFAVE